MRRNRTDFRWLGEMKDIMCLEQHLVESQVLFFSLLLLLLGCATNFGVNGGDPKSVDHLDNEL